MRWGTSHFESIAKACSYYKPYGYNNTLVAVQRKLAEGEIHIGKPESKENQTVSIDRDGRYWIEESEAVCNGPFGDEESCPVHGAEIRRGRGRL